MPNVQSQNLTFFASNESFFYWWKATRLLKTAGWRYKSSSDGSAKETSGNPANDKWGGGGIVRGPITGAFTIGTPTSTSFGGRSTITGLSGMTSASEGHFLTITGATNGANNGTWLITKFISSSSVRIENPAAVAETTPGGATFTEISAMLDSYPVALQGASGLGAWWNAQGPSTLKIPIGNSNPTGYIRGENVTQTTSGATGELLGVIPDTVGGNGYMVVAPRLSGTGSGVRGWSNTSSITGDRSGTSFSPSANVIEYVREIVIWKHNATNGHIYFQVLDSVNEATTTIQNGRFSTLAALATATATICPGGASGGNPTTNGFPTIGTHVVLGTGGPGVVSTGSINWMLNNNSVTSGNGQLLFANAIEETTVSADGSFTIAVGTPVTATTSFVGVAYHRVDDQEDGDVDPYVWYSSNVTSAYGGSRTARLSASNDANLFSVMNNIANTGLTQFTGWRRRGYSTGDTWTEFQGAFLSSWDSTADAALQQNPQSIDRVACSFSNIAAREPIWIVNTTINGLKMRKGTLRWWYSVQGGNGTDTHDGKRWIQLSSTLNIPIVAGPTDQTTVPTNS